MHDLATLKKINEANGNIKITEEQIKIGQIAKRKYFERLRQEDSENV